MKQNYFIMYLIIVGVQLLICNYAEPPSMRHLMHAYEDWPEFGHADRFRHRPNRGLPR